MEKMKRTNRIHVDINNETVKTAEHYIQMVGMGNLNSTILLGPAGMGKTQLVESILERMDVSYIKYGGHITLAGIYEFLFENHNGLIFFDDVSQVVNKTEIMEMLKQALNNSGDRILNYRSKTQLSEGVPNRFSFDGRMIFAFNVMDKSNGNVKAILDRSGYVELKYNRKEIIKAMYQIAEVPGHGLRNCEKLIVTKEIEDYTDSSMDISFRKQALAFKIYKSFKQIYGEFNTEWIKQVQRLFGKKKRTWIEELIIDLVGENGKIERSELIKEIVIRKDVSTRTVHRQIADYLAVGVIHQNKKKGGLIALKPF